MRTSPRQGEWVDLLPGLPLIGFGRGTVIDAMREAFKIKSGILLKFSEPDTPGGGKLARLGA
jgi:hypothetical protein